MDRMTEPTKPLRPFDDPDTDEFAVEHDETWIADRSRENTEEPEWPPGHPGTEAT
jgi:hypothetical protein